MKVSRANLLTVFLLALCCILFLLLSYLSYTNAARTAAATAALKPLVLLDPGHGGEDGGTRGLSPLCEKDINLDISLQLREKLVQAGCRVVMTRESDEDLGDKALSTVRERKTSDIHKRLKILNANPGCLFVSIHQNHFPQSVYSGAQVFYSKNNPASLALAESVRQAICAATQPANKRECKPATSSIYLLRHAKDPAVLVECGFLSNPSEAKLLNEKPYRQKLASAIANGVLAYLQSAASSSAAPGAQSSAGSRNQATASRQTAARAAHFEKGHGFLP